MWVCSYILCVYAYGLSVGVHVFECLRMDVNVGVSMYLCIHTYGCKCGCVCVCMRMDVSVGVSMYLCVYMYGCKRGCVHVFVCVCIWM